VLSASSNPSVACVMPCTDPLKVGFNTSACWLYSVWASVEIGWLPYLIQPMFSQPVQLILCWIQCVRCLC
jgi:hypothetical protein